MFLVIIVYALFASVFTTAKSGLLYAAPFFLVGSRMAAAGILLLGYQFLFHRDQFRFSIKDWKIILLLSFFTIYLTNVFEFWGLQYLTSFKTCLLYSLSPFLSALIAYFTLGERMNSKKWLGLAIGFIGLMPILLSQTDIEEKGGKLFLFSWAELAVLIAVICSVYGWILLKKTVGERGYSPIMANGMSMLVGGSFALLHSYAFENWDPLPVSDYPHFLLCALTLIVVSNFICYNLYGYLLKRYSTTFMSFAGLTTPLFTALFGWLFLGEIASPAFYLSFTVLFAGLFLFYQEELKPLPLPSEN